MRFETKHWMLLAGFLTASGAVLAGLDTWADATQPAVVGGFLGQLAVMITAIFTEAAKTSRDQ